jgi:hypothetical protein
VKKTGKEKEDTDNRRCRIHRFKSRSRAHEKGHCVRVLDNLSPQIHGDNPEKSELF